MRSVKSIVAGCAFSLVAASAGPAMAERPVIGAVDKAQGEVAAVYDGSASLLVRGSDVAFEDMLKTGPEARVQSTLKDGTQLTLGEKATLKVDEYVYDPSQTGGQMTLDVVEGAFLFVGGKIEGETGGNVAINTPVGTLGVRGTTVWGGRIGSGYGVLVLDGEVTVTTGAGTVTLNAGEATMVYDGGKYMEDAHSWPKHKIDEAVETISFQ